jgi:hypothetical protein
MGLFNKRALVAHKPQADQSPPVDYRPVWHVGHLVYQGGVPRLKASSLTGGGFLPMRDLAGKEAPSWQPQAYPIGDFLGGGAIPSRPAFLQPLSGASTTAQF